MRAMWRFIRKHRQKIVNVVLVLVLGQYIVRELQVDSIFIKPALIDVTFFIHNCIFIGVILIRREHVQVDKNWLHWLVAMLSFFSGLFFLKSSVGDTGIDRVADAVNFGAIVIGIAALLSLGRSFGIVPAVRRIQTGGLYRVVRHPMFVSDILFKIPVLMKYCTIYNVAVFAASLALYVLRARYEEELLIRSDKYRRYQQRVKYRFVPYLY